MNTLDSVARIHLLQEQIETNKSAFLEGAALLERKFKEVKVDMDVYRRVYAPLVRTPCVSPEVREAAQLYTKEIEQNLLMVDAIKSELNAVRKVGDNLWKEFTKQVQTFQANLAKENDPTC